MRTGLCGRTALPQAARGLRRAGGLRGRVSPPSPCPALSELLECAVLLDLPLAGPVVVPCQLTAPAVALLFAVRREWPGRWAVQLFIPRFQHLPPKAVVEGGVWGQEVRGAAHLRSQLLYVMPGQQWARGSFVKLCLRALGTKHGGTFPAVGAA